MGGGEDLDFRGGVPMEDRPEDAPATPALPLSGVPSEEAPTGGGASGPSREGLAGPGAAGGGLSGAGLAGDARSTVEHEEITSLRRFLEKLERALGGGNAAQKGPATSVSEAQTLTIGGPPGGASPATDAHEVVFVQENVAVHPGSPSWRHGHLPGCLYLVKQGPALVMSWVPYPLEDATEQEDEFVHQQGRPMKEVAVADFHSVRRYAPALGYHYLIIAFKSGLALPPLFFHSGGVKAFLSTLRLYTALSRAKDNRDVYLINLVKDPLKKSLSQLGLPESVASSHLGNLRQRDSWMLEGDDREPLTDDAEASSPAASEHQQPAQPSTQKKTKKHPSPEDVALNVLEKLSMVTRFARDATSQLMAGLLEEDPPVRPKPGGDFREPERSLPGRAVREEVGRWSRGSTKGGPGRQEEQAQENIPGRQLPLEIEEWRGYLDSEGRVKDPEALRRRIFFGGVEPSLREEVWKFLLGYHSFSSTASERAELKERKAAEYAALRGTWQGISEQEARQREGFQDQLNAVDKDVTRTEPHLPFYEGDNNANVAILRSILITYSFYNPELGYCQGMCDLLSPILFVMRDEAEAFWCFDALMKRVGPNFHQDQNGMQLQLLIVGKLVQLLDPALHAHLRDEDCLNYFFCFRWIFLQFKREFEFEEVMCLWDVLWSRHLSPHFHLFLCVAVLRQQEPIIMEEQMDFETLLKYINELSGNISLEVSLAEAEKLCVKATRLLK